MGRFQTRSRDQLTPWQQEVVVIEKLQHLTGRAFLQEDGKDELEAIMHLLMRILVHTSSGITHEATRQRQSQLAAAGLVQQSGGHARTNGMQFQFGELPFQAKQ